MDDLLDPLKCNRQSVYSTEVYAIDLLKFDVDPAVRNFQVAVVTTKKNCKQVDVEQMFRAITEFVQNTSEENPCYVLIDVTKTDAFTLEQLKFAAAAFKAVRSYLETRLVGSMVKVSDDAYEDTYLSQAFRKLYTPVRPVCWWRKDGDFKAFVEEWEAKLQ